MSANTRTTRTTPLKSVTAAPQSSRAAKLVESIRAMSDEHVADELAARRSRSYEERIQRATSARKERAQAAAARLRAL